jgi:hypothetical protein
MADESTRLAGAKASTDVAGLKVYTANVNGKPADFKWDEAKSLLLGANGIPYTGTVTWNDATTIYKDGKQVSSTPAPKPATSRPDKDISNEEAEKIIANVAAATKTGTDAEIAAGLKAATNLGIGEALLNDPTYGAELKKVFELYKTNKTAAIDALFKTKFAKLDSDARARYVTKLENSDLYKQGLKSWTTGIKRQLKQQGSTLTDQQLEDYYMRGIDEITILDEALTGTKFEPGKTGGSQADLYNQILRTATANGISTNLLPKVLGFDTIDQVIKELQTGASLDDFNQKIRNYAKAAVPEWAKKLIDQGSDLTDIISPYRATMADELELPYTSIDVTDRNIQNALSSNMSLAEMRKQLRQDSRWQYTDRAKEEVSNVALGVLKDFGFQG